MSNVKRIDHLGIAVWDLEAGIALYKGLLGSQPESVLDFPQEKVKIAFFKTGESYLELLQPTSEESPIHRFLEKRGEGIHHVCFRVQDLESTMKNASSQDLRVLDKKPRNGAHHTKVCFLHPKDTHGVLIEFSEGTPPC
jgi:methylmalonyl-CoA/ethylmalonyl-CoA epimerase